VVGELTGKSALLNVLIVKLGLITVEVLNFLPALEPTEI
jgi:hypothetical protein